ncbi:MAG: glycoside hydrolase family 2 protein [Tannerella sp.]|nr:glycoside hydrolase family 2 protein [Tannerella sp.]
MEHKRLITIFMLFALMSGLTGCGESTRSRNSETGKIEWPEVTGETKPWTRWWWHGSAVTEEGLTAALEAYRDAGLGGVEITPIYGVRGKEDLFIEFLSPEWMDKLAYTLKEAQRLGLGVDLANASGWPFGGPWVDDETACKYMVSKVYKVQGGQKLTEAVEYIQQPIVRTAGSKRVTIKDIKEPVTANSNLQEYAFDQVRYEKKLPVIAVTAGRNGEDGFTESIDLTDRVADGRLEWTAPEGEWTVCALFLGHHGKMVERAGPGGEGNVIDHFSAEALEKYLTRFDEAFKGRDLGYLRYFFNDSYEVDDAQGESNWTPEFFAGFRELNGYELKEHLPALLGLDTEEKNSRVIYDYRAAINGLLLEKYTRNWQRWAAGQGKGIRNQSHGSPGNLLDLYAASDVPEIEGNDIVNLKSAPSAAHVTGKKLISSESATWLGEHFESTLGDVKSNIDRFLLAGVNHVFYHGTAYSPTDAAWPGWLFYAAVHFEPANSFHDDFGAVNRSVARAQSFLQSGRPSNDILVYYAIADEWSAPSRSMLRHTHTNTVFQGIREYVNELTENGYTWDAISDRQLLDVLYRNSTLHTGGNSYKTILAPATHYMPAATFEKLMSLAHDGATVLFCKELPADVPGLAGLEPSRRKMVSLKENLSFEQNGRIRIAGHGKGRIIVSDDITALMAEAGVVPESMYAAGLQCIRRIRDDGNFYYFILNASEKPFEGWLTLNADYGSAALYNPMTGADGYASTRGNNGQTELYVQMKPRESLIVETFKGRRSGAAYPFYELSGEAVAVSGNWDISFVKGGPVLPAALSVNAPVLWNSYGGEYAAFSGTAAYTARIPSLPSTPDAWLLDLGEVHESASVHINGKYVGTLVNSPYSLEIPAGALKGGDELTVRVSNLMANRIAELDKRGVEWKIFYNTNINARFRENTGTDGKFSAKGWTPKDSGLSGPVTLTPLVLKNK